MSTMIITYATTDDNFNGSPWMPDGDAFWSIVTRDRGHTIWRRIAAAADNNPSRVILAANGARLHPLAAKRKHKHDKRNSKPANHVYRSAGGIGRRGPQ
jgi:hypothetical protein